MNQGEALRQREEGGGGESYDLIKYSYSWRISHVLS